MSGVAREIVFCLLAGRLLALTAFAEEKKEAKKPEPPNVVVVLPLAVTPGVTNKITIRGFNLTNATEVRFSNAIAPPELTIKSKTKIEVPKEQDAKKVGDTQLELGLAFPADAATATNYFIVVTPDGESEPKPLIVLPAGSLVGEKEPNGGFHQAQRIEFGQTIQGAIKEAADVDVFRFNGQAGQRIIAEVSAARFGSALDSILTLYDAEGHILATVDDTDGKPDSILRAKLLATGTCYLTVIDAHDKGGPTHVYLLAVTEEK